MMEAGGGGAGAGGRDERVPQWGAQETRELIVARGEVEREADAARRSAKTMWEAVAARLRERGYRRTADQCKCKWKNLVNRYKVINNPQSTILHYAFGPLRRTFKSSQSSCC
jgi:hypothetical protein